MADDEDDTSLEVSQRETQFVPQENDELYAVIEILAENKTRYKVLWDGVDPETGEPWKPSWVPKHDVTDDLVAEWKRKKAKAKKAKGEGKGKGKPGAAAKRRKGKVDDADGADYASPSTRNTRSSSRTQDKSGNSKPARRSSSPGSVVTKVVPPTRKRRDPPSDQPAADADVRPGEVDSDSETSVVVKPLRVGPPRKKRKLDTQSSPQKAFDVNPAPPRLKTYAKSREQRRLEATKQFAEEEEEEEESDHKVHVRQRATKRSSHHAQIVIDDDDDIIRDQSPQANPPGEDFRDSPAPDDLGPELPEEDKDGLDHTGDNPFLDDPFDSQAAPQTQNSREHLVIPETQSTHRGDDTLVIEPPQDPPPPYISRENLGSPLTSRERSTKKRKVTDEARGRQDVNLDDTIDSFATQPSDVPPPKRKRPKGQLPGYPKTKKDPQALRPIPIVSPSVFRPYLPAPTSPIESFSPDRSQAVTRGGPNHMVGVRIPRIPTRSPEIPGPDEVESAHELTVALEAAYVDYSGGELEAPGSPKANGGGFSATQLEPPPGTASTQRAEVDSQSQIILVKDSQPTNAALILAEKDEELVELRERIAHLEAQLEHAQPVTGPEETEMLKMKNELLQDEVKKLRSELDLLKAESEDTVPVYQLEEQASSLKMAEMEISELREALQSIRTNFSLSANSALAGDGGPSHPLATLLEQRFEKAQEELRKWKGICEMLQEKDRRTDDEVRRRAAEHPELVGKCRQLRQETVSLQDEIATWTKDYEAMETRNKELEKDKQTLEQDVAQLRAQLDSERAEREEVEKALTAATQSVQEHARDDAERAELSKKLSEALRDLDQGRVESASALEAERALKNELQNRLDEIQVELVTLREDAGKHQTLESANQTLCAELAALKADYEGLRDTLSDLAAERDALKEDCADLRSKVALLEAERDTALKEQQTLRANTVNLETMRARLSELEVERDALRDESADLRSSVDSAKRAEAMNLDRLNKQVDQLSEERDELADKLRHGELETSRLREHASSLDAQLQELHGHAASLGDELEELKGDKKRLEENVERMRIERDAMKHGYDIVQEVERRLNGLVKRSPPISEAGRDVWVCRYRHDSVDCHERFDDPQTMLQHSLTAHY